MRVEKVLKSMLGMCRESVIRAAELIEGERPKLMIWVRVRAARRAAVGDAENRRRSMTKVAANDGGDTSTRLRDMRTDRPGTTR